MPEISKYRILAGRKAVEEYREAHTKLYEVKAGIHEHGSLAAQLVEKLINIGFNSMDDFFEANKQANLEVLASSVVRLNRCDWCPGKKKACIEGCWAVAHESKTKPNRVESEYKEGRTRRLKACIKQWPDHWAPHLPLKLGDEFPMLPGCNMIVKVVKEPEIDWTWK